MNASAAAAVAVEGVGLHKDYGEFALDVPAVEIPAGTTLAVLGPSGSGKSTLLHLLGLLERPDAGEVRFDGSPVGLRDRTARRQTAAVFQRPYLFNGTVADNVAFGLALRRVDRDERSRRVDETLERVGLAGVGRQAAGTLSGGEAQRVALARALAIEPRVLLLDEPLSSLDAQIKERLIDDFSRILRAEGVTTLYVTHDQGEAARVCDRVAIMREGGIVREGSAHDVMTAPSDDWTAGFVGMEPPLRGRITASVGNIAEIQCGDASVFALSELPPGVDVLAAIRPEDVTLFEGGARLPSSSARNQLAMTVTQTTPRGATVRVVLTRGGVRLAASISHAAAAELDLAPGREVVALFKATAMRVVAARTGGFGE